MKQGQGRQLRLVMKRRRKVGNSVMLSYVLVGQLYINLVSDQPRIGSSLRKTRASSGFAWVTTDF